MESMNHELKVALHNLLEMLVDRGEDITEAKAVVEGIADEGVLYQELYEDITTPKTQVFLALNKTILQNFIKGVIKDATVDLTDSYKRTHFIVLVSDPPTTNMSSSIVAKDKELQASASHPSLLQIFTLKELQYNPSRHVLVPKHELMTQDEVKELMTQHHVKSKAQLPHILKTDIMAKWLGLRSGDVVRITRYNENSGTYYYYRYCV